MSKLFGQVGRLENRELVQTYFCPYQGTRQVGQTQFGHMSELSQFFYLGPFPQYFKMLEMFKKTFVHSGKLEGKKKGLRLSPVLRSFLLAGRLYEIILILKVVFNFVVIFQNCCSQTAAPASQLDQPNKPLTCGCNVVCLFCNIHFFHQFLVLFAFFISSSCHFLHRRRARIKKLF